MKHMFMTASSFDNDGISMNQWNVSSLTNMSDMFNGSNGTGIMARH